MKVPSSVFTIYKNLENSKLVKYGVVDDETISYFIKTLNKSQIRLLTPADKALNIFIRDLYSSDKTAFLNYVNGSIRECLVLWTEGQAIVNQLGIQDRIYLKWNRDKYEIYRLPEPITNINSNKHDNKHDMINQSESIIEYEMSKPAIFTTDSYKSKVSGVAPYNTTTVVPLVALPKKSWADMMDEEDNIAIEEERIAVEEAKYGNKNLSICL